MGNPLFDEALHLWKSNSGSVNPPTGRDRCIQKVWDRPVPEVLAASLFSKADATTGARLIASQQKESGAWLSVPPVSALGLRLDNYCIRVVVGLRLGSSLCLLHSCTQCGAWTEDTGLHALSCCRSKGRLPRHSALNDIVKRALVDADIPATLKPRGLCQGDERCPDGVSLIPWHMVEVWYGMSCVMTRLPEPTCLCSAQELDWCLIGLLQTNTPCMRI